MKKIRTLVIDDEPLARARIVKLLEQFDEFVLLGECKNGQEALEKISNYKPDLIFLDIQMPDLNGFELLSNFKLEPLPFIIFVTAYDKFAIKAFDVHAVDYLLKPFDDDRFVDALHHAKEQIIQKRNMLIHQQMLQLLDHIHSDDSKDLQFIEFKDKGRTQKLLVADIYYVEAQGNYLRLYTKDRAILIRETLQSISTKLDSKHFFRIHRSIIVNLNYVDQIKYQGNNQFIFQLKNEQSLLSSRSFKAEIETLLDKEQ